MLIVLKLRGSWGQLGNDRMDPDPNRVRNDEFQFANNFGFGNGYVFDYTTLTTTITPSVFPIANPNITWEVANNTNIGLEGTLFGGKISFELDYFNNVRSKMLIIGMLLYHAPLVSLHLVKTLENSEIKVLISC